MLVCKGKNQHVLAVKRTQLRTTAIIFDHNVRKHRVFENTEFDRSYQIVGYPPEDAAKNWLNSTLKMTDRVREELEMIIEVKKNKVVAKYEEAPEGATGVLVGDVLELAENCNSLKVLKAIHNNCVPADEKLKTFGKTTTLADAASLTWAAMEAYEPPKKKEKVPKVKGESKPRAGKVDNDAVITVLVENPKRKGSASYDRFELYENGMTVAQAKEAGVKPADVLYDLTHNFISVG